MLINRADRNPSDTLDDLHPFLRLPRTGIAGIFQGWGPTL
jgi:hypothetical protein